MGLVLTMRQCAGYTIKAPVISITASGDMGCLGGLPKSLNPPAPKARGSLNVTTFSCYGRKGNKRDAVLARWGIEPEKIKVE
jgi:hypothetical protein